MSTMEIKKNTFSEVLQLVLVPQGCSGPPMR